MFDLLSKRWLHPTTDNEVVNRLLMAERPGTFLVRLSRERGSFVVCVRYPGDVKQFKVPRSNEGFRLADGVSAPSIQDLVVLLRAQPLVYPLARYAHRIPILHSCCSRCPARSTRLIVNAPVASGVDLVRPEPLASKAARAVAEAWWRFPEASRFLSAPARATLGTIITTHYIPYGPPRSKPCGVCHVCAWCVLCLFRLTAPSSVTVRSHAPHAVALSSSSSASPTRRRSKWPS